MPYKFEVLTSTVRYDNINIIYLSHAVFWPFLIKIAETSRLFPFFLHTNIPWPFSDLAPSKLKNVAKQIYE